MANVANMRQMRLIQEMIRRPPEGVIMAERDEAGDFSLYHPSNRQLLKDSQLLCINEENIFEWDIFIDIRSFIYDENIPGFHGQFALGGNLIAWTRAFILFPQTPEENASFYSDGVRTDRQQYLNTFPARLHFLDGDEVCWLNTAPGPVQDNFFGQRDSVIYDRMMPDSEFLQNVIDNLQAGTPYRTEDLYPFGEISARLTFPPEYSHSPPKIKFINSRIFHPNIFPDGSVHPMVYAENWRSGQSEQNMFNSILRILRAPNSRFRANEEAARKLWGIGHQQ